MKRVMAVMVSLYMTHAQAAGTLSGPESNGNFTVKSIMADGNGVLRYFTVNETIPVCTLQTNQFWFDQNYVSEEGLKAILSVLLAAKATKTGVQVYYTTVDNYCRATLVGIN